MLKLRLSTLVVTLPLLAVPAGVTMSSPSQAATAAEEAVRLLSRARAADRKCGYLAASDRRDLERFAARAEIAAVSQGSAASAKSAAAAGRADGSGASCSPELKADVIETVEAARQALAAASATQDDESQTGTKPRRQRRAEALGGGDEPVQRYDRIVRAYYLERECRSLPRADATRFWKAVASLHRTTVAASGRNAVARVMADAERSASGSFCSGTARARIAAGYREVSGR